MIVLLLKDGWNLVREKGLDSVVILKLYVYLFEIGKENIFKL